MIIASNWHLQKHLNYLSAAVTQSEILLAFGKLVFFYSLILIRENQSPKTARAKMRETLSIKYLALNCRVVFKKRKMPNVQ